MSEGTDQPVKRGEAAWKAQLDAVNARHAEASKRGKAEREARELADIQRRAATERRQMDAIASKKPEF